LTTGVNIAHALEDCFVAAQGGRLQLRVEQIDLLLRGVDLLSRIASPSDIVDNGGTDERADEVEVLLGKLQAALQRPPDPPALVASPAASVATSLGGAENRDNPERALRVTAEHLNRLVGIAAEALVESRRLKPFAESLLRLKRQHGEAVKAFDALKESLPKLEPRADAALTEVRHRMRDVGTVVADRLVEIETFDNRSTILTNRLYAEALSCRMRPFADGVAALPRMVRDISRALDKRVRLEIVGSTTLIDRDILERLDGPLGHLLRNAIDHGIETARERGAAGKPAESVISLEARHSAGMLQIVLADDGRGIDVDALRTAVVEREFTTADAVHALSEAEMFEFLFLPGFSMKGSVTEISGRGVGLDAVRNMVKSVGGTIAATSQAGKGARFELQLPLSLSVVRTLLADVGGEPYAFPLSYIVRTLKLRKDEVESVEGRQLFEFEGRPVGLVGAQQIFNGGKATIPRDGLPVIVVGHNERTYGLMADGFLGERELVVQSLDRRLGKIKNIASGALMEDGSPTLIVDVEDLIHSIEALVTAGTLNTLRKSSETATKRKRVLVVDDSLTVRELQRKLLDNAGYEVELAVNGMDGWNSIRTSRFDLVVTDIDMPRMDGIELVTLIKNDAHLKSVPVVIVSYKDREEDRRRGLDAGADYFLSKGSFHDETLLHAVIDLIGHAAA
ncbi:MAG: hybrid sensor histidine kinase/response regulator, partial [Candidatus Eremiobacteraeota bacterium]|nr:hybrid sensor histidine kinase/response regulator [Candidatus Eremiobacteraeota bacterium]